MNTRTESDTIDLKKLAAAITVKRRNGSHRRPCMSVREVAQETGVSHSSINRAEHGMMICLESYIKVCFWLEVPLETFIIQSAFNRKRVQP